MCADGLAGVWREIFSNSHITFASCYRKTLRDVFYSRGCRPAGPPLTFPGAAAPEPPLTFPGAPASGPPLSFPGAAAPGPPLLFQGLPPPRPRFFPTSRGPWLCVWKLSECHPTRIRVESASVFLHADSDILYTANAPDGILYRHPDSPRAAVMAVSFYSPKICIHTRTMP